MFTEQISRRQEEILNILNTQKYITVNNLSEILNVSHSTIRRDIKILEKRGIVNSFHGGIALKEDYGTFSERKVRYPEEKQRIGTYCAGLVNSGEIIYIGGGSTCNEFARALAKRTDIEQVAVITCAFNIARYFIKHPGFKVIMAGGELIDEDESMTSKITIDAVKQFNFNKAFIGCSGVNVKQGIMYPNLALNELKKIVIDNSKYVILMIDHSKIGKISAVSAYPINRANLIVTDNGVQAREIEELRSTGIDLKIV